MKTEQHSVGTKEPDSSQGTIVDEALLNYMKGGPTSRGLRHLTTKMLGQLQDITKSHWDQQHINNKEKLNKIVNSPKDDILIHDHSVKRLPKGKAQQIYESYTIELSVLTDPHLFEFIQVSLE